MTEGSSTNHYPKTSEQAKECMQKAIDDADFDLAAKYYQEYNEFLNLEDEMRVGRQITQYFDKNQILSTQIAQTQQTFEERTQSQIDSINQIYKEKLVELEKVQEQEIDELAQKWREHREEKMQSADLDFQQSIATAKLVASQYKFEEATRIKNEAIKKKNEATSQASVQIDEYFERQLSLMKKRHKIEIKKLVQSRNNEIHTLKLMLDEAPTQAVDCFQVDNATNVVQVVHGFNYDRKAPLSLKMQTVNGQRLDPENGPRKVSKNNGFTQRMQDLNEGLTSPMPLSEKKKKVGKGIRSLFETNSKL